jgi:hypothetical protein
LLTPTLELPHGDPSYRKQHIRKTDRYQSDLTDEEWGCDQASAAGGEEHGTAARLADA